MAELVKIVKQHIDRIKDAKKDYKALQKHLNSMPIGFPKTISGVEKRILKTVFSPEEARAALCLGCKYEAVETIIERADASGIPPP